MTAQQTDQQTQHETERAAKDTQQDVSDYILEQLAKAGIPADSAARVMEAFMSEENEE